MKSGYWQTGERVCPDFDSGNFRNHRKAYLFAAQFAQGQVLDVGCGTGYGTAILAAHADSVTGIDISRQAIRYAKRHYGVSNVRFERMAAEQLRFPDHTFEFIVSTENFEHLRDHETHLREVTRVLSNDGLFFLATPNPERFVGEPKNPYHTREFHFEELLGLLKNCFSDVEILETQIDPKPDRGMLATADLYVFGKKVLTEYLSNTHSFFAFANDLFGRYEDRNFTSRAIAID